MKKYPLVGLTVAAFAVMATAALAQAPVTAPSQAPVAAPNQIQATAPAPTPGAPQAAGSWGTAEQNAAPATNAAPEAIPDWLQYQDPYGAHKGIGEAHRANPEITAWVQEKATDIMTMTAANYEGKMAAAQALFAPTGWRDYNGYLQSAKISELVQKRGYSMRMIADGEARIVNQGSVQNAYRWQLEMPVIIAFDQIDTDGASQPRGGDRFRLQLQVVRTANKATEDGLAIEMWKVMPQAGAPAAR